MQHTFEKSGLGKAPFVYCEPKASDVKDLSGVFYCMHCGTIIQHRHFILSADKQYSVVGIDCLKKTDDTGLIENAKIFKKKTKFAEREAARITKQEEILNLERANNNGLTNHELQEARNKKAKQIREKFADTLINSDDGYTLLKTLNFPGFGDDILNQIYNCNKLTTGQSKTLIKLITKQLTGNARVNSKEFILKKPKAEKLVNKLNKKIDATLVKIANI